MGLQGFEEGDPDDPFVLIPGQPVATPTVPGPFRRERRETTQLFSFLVALSASGACDDAIGVEVPADDPPDRVLTVGKKSWAVELTQLTVGDIMQQISIVRKLARSVEEQVHANAPRFIHLEGCTVSLSVVNMAGIPKDTSALAREILDDLSVDRGYVGQGIDTSQGLPEKLPNSNGFYGFHADTLSVQVNRTHDPSTGKPPVSASVQCQFKRSEAIAALRKRVQEKDDERNDILLVTFGLPDAQGYVTPPDLFLYQAICDQKIEGKPLLCDVGHLDSVVAHHWVDGSFIELWRREGTDMPWS